MSKKILLRKTCSVYASKLHLATMIFPFVDKEIENGAFVKTILEKDISENIEKIIQNIGLKKEIKNKIEQVDWTQTNIEKIKQLLKEIEEKLVVQHTIHIIVSGSNLFIKKVNEVIDLWEKIQLETIEKNDTIINVVNCYSFDENERIDEIMEEHEYILNTKGIEEICENEVLKKAN